ncbi:MAG: hypothetical protein CR989_02895 [Flavobacteriales bacterium]|nr:MAG: hypothetical protein CR989_02895 [Flavobacteriales bacterium]
MKKLQFILTLFLLLLSVTVLAQKIEYNGKEYHVKKDKIFLDGVDVTTSLNDAERTAIKTTLAEKLAREKKLKEAEEAQKKAEKKQKKAEKSQKKAEKKLKKRENAQKALEKSQKKHKKDMAKYEKLKRKGKLSPEDEGKWLKKLEKQKEKIVNCFQDGKYAQRSASQQSVVRIFQRI